MSAAGSSQADALKALRELVAEAGELQSAAGGSVTDAVAGWLAPQYLLAARAKLAAADGGGRFEVLRLFVQDWNLLRRGDHASARLQLDRDQFAAQQANRQSQKEAEFREWIKKPEVRQEFFPERTGGISQETMRKIERELNLM
jgi:hypothetical protein